jgi:hypothetical protein
MKRWSPIAFRTPRMARFVAVLCILGSVLAACGSDESSGLRPDDWATIGAYEQHVVELNTQVAVLMTTVPTVAPATPQPPFATAWKIEVAEQFTAQSFPDPNVDGGESPDFKARGSYLVIEVTVQNVTLRPIDRFPWWQMRLVDAPGRLFTPDTDATDAYVATRTDVRKPNEYQPSLSYSEVVVFDVPSDLAQPILGSADETLSLPLLGVPPIPTSTP